MFLGIAFQLSGQPGRAVSIARRAKDLIAEEQGVKGDNPKVLSSAEGLLSYALCLTGALRDAEGAARRAAAIAAHADNIVENMFAFLAMILAVRGVSKDAETLFERASAKRVSVYDLPLAWGAEFELWRGDALAAKRAAEDAWAVATQTNADKMEIIRWSRLQGMAALSLGDLTVAEERLHYALTTAQSVNHAEDSLPALIGLAELRRLQKDYSSAREFLDDVWEQAERGPYPIYHADAYNVLAQIERDEGKIREAVEAASEAYRKAWCDGPPFAYHWGLEKAKKHLRELNAAEPTLPAFDESKYPPMPQVEIDPPAEPSA